MITKEEEKEMHEHWMQAQDELEQKWNKAKEELKDLIHPKYFDFAENNDTFYSCGVVEIVETNERTNGYRNKRHCKINDEEDLKLYLHGTDNIESYGEESKYEGEEVEYWVWQTTGYCEDDYSGFLLLPMLDGRFWKVAYSC